MSTCILVNITNVKSSKSNCMLSSSVRRNLLNEQTVSGPCNRAHDFVMQEVGFTLNSLDRACLLPGHCR